MWQRSAQAELLNDRSMNTMRCEMLIVLLDIDKKKKTAKLIKKI